MTVNMTTLRNIRLQRVTHLQAESAYYDARAKLAVVDRDIAAYLRQGRILKQGANLVAAPGDTAAQTLLNLRTSSQTTVNTRLTDRNSAATLLAQYTNSANSGSNPTVDIEQLPDDTPMVLFPVRVEYRFASAELRVRIIPDEVSVETHEPELTVEELAAGQSFWTRAWAYAQGAQAERDLWRELVGRFGVPRAGWIRRLSTPTNPAARQTATAPIFPVVMLREGAWTRPPRVRTFPDRFVVCVYHQGVEEARVTGAAIPDPLIVGPDPLDIPTLNPAGSDLALGTSVAWMTDFTAAETIGMGVRIPLNSTQQTRGFDRLVVLGVRLSADRHDGQARLETLFQNHHYRSGLELLPQGTPTNNTARDRSAYVDRNDTGDDGYEYEVLTDWSPVTDSHLKNDAQRLAEAFGVQDSTFRQIRNHKYEGARLAEDMNRALFRATLGYYLDAVLEPVTTATIASARKFMTRYVHARGPFAALRVGNQPYGIHLTSAFSRYNPGTAALAEYSKVWAAVNAIDPFWRDAAPLAERVSPGGDVTQKTVKALALHPASVELHDRYAMGREFLFQWLRFGGARGTSAQTWYDAVDTVGDQLAAQVGISAETSLSSMLTYWRTPQWRVFGALVDKTATSETGLLGGAASGVENYITSLLAASVFELRRNIIGQRLWLQNHSQPLLYRMMHHALTLELWEGAVRLHVAYNGFNEGLVRREHPLINMAHQPIVTRWDMIAYSVPHPSGSAAPIALLPNTAIPEGADWREVRDSFTKLATVPTAELERLMIEHFDLCAYRLDAWKTGFYEDRLSRMRAATTVSFPPAPAPPSPPANRTAAGIGVYLGAYGWLENVRPRATPTIVPASDPDLQALGGSGALPGSGSVIEYATNEGRILAPSMTHAMTAAVLRSGHRRFKSTTNPDRFSIDLSSQRVRLGMELIEGLRRGQTLEDLLGYRFERELHDRSGAGSEVDRYILDFRMRFPSVGDKVHAGTGTDDRTALAGGQVVDGLALIEAYRAGNYPWTVTGLPASTSPDAESIRRSAAAVSNALDAFADLCVAEEVHQAISGNFARANAAMDMLSRGGPSDEPSVIATPRSGYAITQRLALVFDTTTPPNPWAPRVAMTPRALAEPRLNVWLASLMTPPADVVARVYFDPDSHVPPEQVRLENLGLQPLDLLALIPDQLPDGTGESELERRIKYAARQNASAEDAVSARVELRERVDVAATVRTFFESMPLWRSLKKLIGASRAMDATHFRVPQEVSTTVANPDGIDATELATRVSAASTSAQAAITAMTSAETTLAAQLVTEVITGAALTAARTALITAASFGVADAFPKNGVSTKLENARELVEQLGAARVLLAARVAVATPLLTAPPAETTADAAVRLTSAAQALFGRDMRIIPRFTIAGPAEVTTAFANKQQLLINCPNPSTAIDEWIASTRHVRPDVVPYALARLQSRMAGRTVRSLSIVQLPYRPGVPWAAGPLGASAPPPGATVAMALEHPATFTASAAQAGMIIDEFSELLPERTGIAGVAVNYDQPASQPPQAILLAVPPTLQNKWVWNDLLALLQDTLADAGKRLVEPEHLASTPLGQFIPTIVAPFTKQNATIGLRFGDSNFPAPPF